MAPKLHFRVPVFVDLNRAPVLFVRVVIGGAEVVLLAPELERKRAVLWVFCTAVCLNVQCKFSQYVGGFHDFNKVQ